tara:strand:+ start:164866 stop:165339 length:474 start_codon:yes stop_codon:yes gene_type:complete
VGVAIFAVCTIFTLWTLSIEPFNRELKMIIVKKEPLRLLADFLIRNGMFDAGNVSDNSLLNQYREALVNPTNPSVVSFVMEPNKGIAILVDTPNGKPQFNLYTATRMRGQGIARDLTEQFFAYMGKDCLDNVECTGVVDTIVSETKMLAEMGNVVMV